MCCHFVNLISQKQTRNTGDSFNSDNNYLETYIIFSDNFLMKHQSIQSFHISIRKKTYIFEYDISMTIDYYLGRSYNLG